MHTPVTAVKNRTTLAIHSIHCDRVAHCCCAGEPAATYKLLLVTLFTITGGRSNHSRHMASSVYTFTALSICVSTHLRCRQVLRNDSKLEMIKHGRRCKACAPVTPLRIGRYELVLGTESRGSAINGQRPHIGEHPITALILSVQLCPEIC